MKVGILGASGYTGSELLRLLAGHPEFEVAVATAHSHAGETVGTHTPSLAAAYPGLLYEESDPARFDGLDLVFCGLPHGESQRIVPDLRPRVGPRRGPRRRLPPEGRRALPAVVRRGTRRTRIARRGRVRVTRALSRGVGGGDPRRGRRLLPDVGRAGLGPLVRAGLVEPTGIVVDAASGVSGAGRGLKDSLHFGAVDEDFTAYGLLTHRHTPEMEQIIGGEVLFTPHLAPMTRGILATCYARPATGTVPTTEAVMAALHEAFVAEPFVLVTDDPPSTKATSGANSAHVTARVDPRTGWVVSLCALDNLVKGASGQAVQCANAAFGLPETTGLPIAGVYP